MAGDPEASTASREQTIIQAAARLFQRHGFEGTSVTRIAKAAGMTPANLYWYFPSKQHILRAFLIQIYESALTDLRMADDPTASASSRLQAYIRTFVGIQLSDIDENATFGYLALQASLGEAERSEIIERQRRHRVLLKEILAQGVRTGEFDIDDLSLTASVLLTSAEYVFLWYRPAGRLTPADVGEQYAKLALRTVGATAA